LKKESDLFIIIKRVFSFYFGEGAFIVPKISQQKKETVRIDILNAARHVFIEKGYEATSMKDIVIHSGRSFGGVYLYFANKEEVFLELLRQQFERMSNDVNPLSELGAWSRVSQFLRTQEQLIREVEIGLAPCMYEYFILGRRDEARRTLIKERYEGVYNSLIALVNEGVQEGEFQPIQPVEACIHWMISMLDGLFLECIMNGNERIKLSDQMKCLTESLRSLLRPTEQKE